MAWNQSWNLNIYELGLLTIYMQESVLPLPKSPLSKVHWKRSHQKLFRSQTKQRLSIDKIQPRYRPINQSYNSPTRINDLFKKPLGQIESQRDNKVSYKSESNIFSKYDKIVTKTRVKLDKDSHQCLNFQFKSLLQKKKRQKFKIPKKERRHYNFIIPQKQTLNNSVTEKYLHIKTIEKQPIEPINTNLKIKPKKCLQLYLLKRKPFNIQPQTPKLSNLQLMLQKFIESSKSKSMIYQ